MRLGTYAQRVDTGRAGSDAEMHASGGNQQGVTVCTWVLKAGLTFTLLSSAGG